MVTAIEGYGHWEKLTIKRARSQLKFWEAHEGALDNVPENLQEYVNAVKMIAARKTLAEKMREWFKWD